LATGDPLTDPRRAAQGLLLPIGGYKGSGLAITRRQVEDMQELTRKRDALAAFCKSKGIET
jgi:hypothetical protein